MVATPIENIVRVGWKLACGPGTAHENAAEMAGLPRTVIYADKVKKPRVGWVAWAHNHSNLGHVEPQFEKTRARAAARFLLKAIEIQEKVA
jgi:hypothetical protein